MPVGEPAGMQRPAASVLGGPAMTAGFDVFAEARRQLSICNACRYCAGYCPVWPELELRTVLTDGDLGYLANLCHDCQDCYTACMYTAPHEFDVNPPRVFAGLRADSYRRYAWPSRTPRWAVLLARRWPTGWRGVATSLVVVATLLILLSYATTGRLLTAGTGPGNPYQILPYPALLVLLAIPAVWCAGVLMAGAIRCWREIHGPLADLGGTTGIRTWPRALAAAFQMRHMRGGGAQCDYPADTPSGARRLLHITLVYGFGLCVVSTVSAAIEQDIAKVAPPYPYLSVPVLAGIIGGVGMVAGGAGLLVLKARADAARTTPLMRRADYAFTAALLVLAVSGLLTLAVRQTPAFGPVLAAHLAAVEVAFAVAPYTKFAHWPYRLLAIYKHTLGG